MASSEDSGLAIERGEVARTPAAVGRAGGGQVRRRTLVAGAALSVPAVALMSVSPALAVSGGSLSVSAPNSQVPAAGAVPVTAMVKNASSQPVAGAAVSFSGPVGASVTPVSATTNGSGAAVTQLDLGTPWAKPGSVVSVSAVSGSNASSASFSVLGSNVVVAGAGYSAVFAQSELVFPSPVVDAVAAGGSTNRWFMALLANGSVWTMGFNSSGQLGDGSTTTRSTWAPVPGLSGVTQIAAAASTGYALLSDGSAKAWGSNFNGRVGDGSTTNRLTPTSVSGLSSGVRQIAAGVVVGYALLSDGSVRAWGDNSRGAGGDGSTSVRLTPTPVSGLSGVTQIAAGGDNGYALLSGGSVRAWGANDRGQVGDGSTTQRLTSTPVSGLSSGVTQIAAGTAAGYALLSDGSVKAWGANSSGQVGDGSTTNRLTPTSVSGLSSGVTQIAAGGATGYALLSGGSVKAWGANSSGQVGDGSMTNQLAPISVNLPAGRVVQRLSTNSTTSTTAMIVMGETTLSVDVVETAIAAGSAATVRAKVQKSSDASGVTGASVTVAATSGAVVGAASGSTDSTGMFQTTVTPDTWTAPGALVRVTARTDVSSAADTVSVLGSNVVVAGAGYSAVFAQSELVFPSPVVDTVAAGLSNPWFMVLLANGTVWTKGDNGRGQLGDESMSARSTWAPVPGLSGVRQIAAGASTGYALSSDGSVKAWGSNRRGQVGDGSTTDRLTPVSVSDLSGVTQIAAGTNTGYALLSGGSVKAWGLNDSGQVGDGSATNRMTPVQVSGLTSGATQLAGGLATGYALLSDGSVRAWGSSSRGQVGDGSTTQRFTPVPVSDLSGVTQIAAGTNTGYALLSDGSVKAWGDNGRGQVGDGSTTNRLTPTSVSGLSSGVTQITVGAATGYALLSDGSVKAWGASANGQVGDGSLTDRTAPVSMSAAAGRVVQRLGTNSNSSYTAMIVLKSD